MSVLSLQGNDITLVARQPWQRRQQGSRETQQFEVVFKEVSGTESSKQAESRQMPVEGALPRSVSALLEAIKSDTRVLKNTPNSTISFHFVYQENWRRPDGMPATREHLMMVLADLDDILIRASYSTEMRSSSIFDISMEVAVPNYSGLAQALEVEQCRCPPGYQGLSCQVMIRTEPLSWKHFMRAAPN